MSDFFWSDPPNHTAFPVVSAGYPYIFASVFTTAVFAFLGLTVLALIGLFVTFFISYFFRDPDRVIPNHKHAVVSPADGKVIFAEPVVNSLYFEGACIKISIFMSIFNVHVNRIPHEGLVKKVHYYPGKFFPPIWIRLQNITNTMRFLLKTNKEKIFAWFRLQV
jgi:phosphatidylserine decarboxylase